MCDGAGAAGVRVVCAWTHVAPVVVIHDLAVRDRLLFVFILVHTVCCLY